MDPKYASRIKAELAARGIKPAGSRFAPRPSQKKSEMAIVMRDPADFLPCVHRKNRVGDTPCGGCGVSKYVEVFACDKHQVCTISKAARDPRFKTCKTCNDRVSGGTLVDFSAYMNKYAGKTGLVVGRGETLMPNEDLAKHDGPIFFINDAVLLEKFCPNNPDTFLFGYDERIAKVMPGIRSVSAVPNGSYLSSYLDHNKVVGLGKIMRWILPSQGQEYLLQLTRDQIRFERRLYMAPKKREGFRSTVPSPTIVPLLHFAWYAGCQHVKLVRCDGYATAYATDLENKSESPIVNVGKYAQARFDAERVMTTLGMTFEYIGSPPRPVFKEPVVQTVDVPPIGTPSFTTTEVDAPTRHLVMEKGYASFAENLKGIDMKACKLYLNIDHVEGGDPKPLIETASKFFREVIVNESGKANFAAAVRWCFSQPTTNWTFHLESDWLLTREVNIADLLPDFSDQHLACTNLRAYPFAENDARICLSPGLWRTAHARTIASRITDEANPESQLRNHSRMNPHGGKHEGFVGMCWPSNVGEKVIIDIGREWLRGTKFRRPTGVGFVSWLHTI